MAGSFHWIPLRYSCAQLADVAELASAKATEKRVQILSRFMGEDFQKTRGMGIKKGVNE
jgi:hypothetical protein